MLKPRITKETTLKKTLKLPLDPTSPNPLSEKLSDHSQLSKNPDFHPFRIPFLPYSFLLSSLNDLKLPLDPTHTHTLSLSLSLSRTLNLTQDTLTRPTNSKFFKLCVLIFVLGFPFLI